MSEELENFYRQNRIRSADSVANIYDDPANAKMLFNTTLPISQVEKNLQAYGGATASAYEPTLREKARGGISDALQYLGTPKGTSDRVARGFMGNPNAETFGQQFGLLDVAPIVNIPFYFQEGVRALDRGDYVGGGIDVGFSLLEGALFAKPLKNFIKSQAKKLKGTPSTTEIVDTKEPVGALPNMMPSTKRASPNLVMTDPKKKDKLGFYSEAERQVKMMQQNKGSGQQFAGYLINKGVKEEELKALGLDELFLNPNVTKKEILDTIDLNKFTLIETTRKSDPNTLGFSMEQFTDITRPDGSSVQSADEVVQRMDSGDYIRPTVTYEDGIFNGFEETLEGTVDTHVATGFKIVSLVTKNNNRDEVYLTFRPNANTNDWRNSIEAKQYLEDVGAVADGTTDLNINDFDTIIQEYAPFTFDEATVRLRSAAENASTTPVKGAKFEEHTQPGGENYSEYVLSLPPIDRAKGFQDDVDFRNPVHFPNYNPVFHIRTKDRYTPDGKKVLYVEELQSDFGQQGRDRGFKLKGEDLEKAKAKLKVAEDDLMKLKDLEVNLTSTEVKDLFQLKNPGVIFVDVNDPKLIDYTTAAGKDPRFKIEVIDPYRPPEEYRYGTIEEVAKLRQYQNYKALHKVGDISDEFFNQLDLNQMGRTEDEIKSEIVKMFSSGRLDRGSLLTTRDGTGGLMANFDDDIKKGNQIIKKYYKAQVQAKGEDAPIPDAPFVKDTEKWTGLAIKRLLQMAEKGDYDHVAFSPGQVQFDRWKDDGLIEYYDKIIPSVAKDVTKKMKDKSANMNTLGKITVPIRERELEINLSGRDDGTFTVGDVETGDILDTVSLTQRYDEYDKYQKYWKTREEAQKFMDTYNKEQTELQETFAINITPKVIQTVKEGLPLFSTVGGVVGLGALGDVPSTQDDGT